MCVCVCVCVCVCYCTLYVSKGEGFDYLDGPLLRVAGADVPMPYTNNLEQLAIPQTSNIVTSALRLLNL